MYSGIILRDDIIEIGNDGVARTVVSVNNNEIIYTPTLATEPPSRTRVDIWGTAPAATLKTDYRLQPESSCVNHGSNGASAETTDLDDNPRQVGGTIDMGAFEVQ